MESQDVAKAEALELTQQILGLRNQKEEAVARQEFDLAARLRDSENECRTRLESFNFPKHVLSNLRRQADGSATSRYPVLEMLETELGAADESVLRIWPESLQSPISIAFEQIPESPSGTLRSVLDVDNVFSMYFQAKLPVLCPETIARFKPNMLGEALRGMFIEMRRCAQQGTAAVLSLVAPTTFLDATLQSKVFQGLKETRCDFVVFEHSPAIQAIAKALLPEVALVQVR